jgi:hypothetical protein
MSHPPYSPEYGSIPLMAEYSYAGNPIELNRIPHNHFFQGTVVDRSQPNAARYDQDKYGQDVYPRNP